MPYFSVIIPLYNKENYVEDTLKSILRQTFSDYEVVLVDDCSTDGSVAKVQPFLSNTVRLVAHTQNSGLSASRNTGIRNSKAQFVTFLDADDTWEPSLLEAFHSMITKFPDESIFAANYREVYPDNTIRLPKNNTSDLKEGEVYHITDFFSRNTQQGFFIHSGICFDKKVFEEVGFYDEAIDFSEDLDFNIRAFSQYDLVYKNSRLVNYTMQSENQLTLSSILGKRIPDYDQYEVLAVDNPQLKSYLDFERYVIAKHLKTDGDTIKYKEITRNLNPKNLNWKQKLLLKLPVPVLRTIKKIKGYLLRKNIRISSYN